VARSNARRSETPRPAKKTGLVAESGNRALQLDRLIHERLRLAVVSALAANPSLSFSELKQSLDATDGNLSVHCRKLEEAGYIRCDKTFENRMPKSVYRLTSAGKKALERYIAHMEALIQAARR
jgi:DNA-binding MarR family transcriptional regulator